MVRPEIADVPRHLRVARMISGLHATNALADMIVGVRLLDEIDTVLGTRWVGVIADVGGGKTQLAAQLTNNSSDRPAGILLHGRDLHSSKTLDDLAGGITIQGVPVASMDALVAALDATGKRDARRLPLVIDELNEAEDTRQWKSLLAALDVSLQQFPNVLVVCTVRTGGSSTQEFAVFARFNRRDTSTDGFWEAVAPRRHSTT